MHPVEQWEARVSSLEGLAVSSGMGDAADAAASRLITLPLRLNGSSMLISFSRLAEGIKSSLRHQGAGARVLFRVPADLLLPCSHAVGGEQPLASRRGLIRDRRRRDDLTAAFWALGPMDAVTPSLSACAGALPGSPRHRRPRTRCIRLVPA